MFIAKSVSEFFNRWIFWKFTSKNVVFRALCAPGHHTSKRRREHETTTFLPVTAKYSPIWLFFRSRKGRYHGNQFSVHWIYTFFSSRCIPERAWDRHIGPSCFQVEYEVVAYVMCRMAPFLMTLDDPKYRNCFRFLLLVREPSHLRKYATNLCEIFRIGSLMGVDDWC